MNLSQIFKEAILEAKKEKPSAGLTKKQKSDVAKKAKAGGDIGKKGKGFEKIAKKAGGGKKGEKIAASAMWKNIKRVKEGSDGQDHEVSMAHNSLKSIIQSCVELMDRLGDDERNLPGWIQDHISNAENFIDQAAQGFHELGGHDEEEEEDEDESEMIQPVDEMDIRDRNLSILHQKLNQNRPVSNDRRGQNIAVELSKKYTPIRKNDMSLADYLKSIGKTIVDIKDIDGIDEKKMTKPEKRKKEEIIKAMKKEKGGKENLTGKDYAAAVSQAIKSAE